MSSRLFCYALGVAGLLFSLGVNANTLIVVSSSSGGAYDAIINTIRDELKNLPRLKIQLNVLDVNPSSPLLPDDTLMILTIGVQATKKMLGMQVENRLPILSVMVPRGAFDIDSSIARWPRKFSEIYVDQPARRQISLARILLPSAKNIAVVVGPANRRLIDQIRADASEKGLTLVAENAYRDTELYPALQSVLRTSDVLLALPDPTVINNNTAQNLLLTALKSRIPVVGYSAAYVRAGALAAAYSTPQHMGEEAARVIRQVTRGSALPESHYPRDFNVAINRLLAESLGLNLPDDISVQQRLRSLEQSE